MFTTLLAASFALLPQDSIAIEVSIKPPAGKATVQWVIRDSANRPVDTGEGATSFERKLLEQWFLVCGVGANEWVTIEVAAKGSGKKTATTSHCIKVSYIGKVLMTEGYVPDAPGAAEVPNALRL